MKNNYIVTGFCKTVSEQFSRSADDLNAALCRRLKSLQNENADASKEKQLHLNRQILPAIAAYEVLQTVMPKEAALQTVHSYAMEHAENNGKKLRALLRFTGLYRIVPMLFTNGTHKMFNESAGFAAAEHQVTGGVWRIDMTKCPYNDTCIKYGCPELCSCFCDSDDLCYGNMHPKLLWSRSKTLGRGGDFCDFCIKIKGR